MDLPLNADVHCTDGKVGTSTHIVINPATQRVSHLVVREDEGDHTERMVPVELVGKTTGQRIQLKMPSEKMSSMKAFTETDYILSAVPHFDVPDMEGADMGPGFTLLPFVTPEREAHFVRQEHERVPPGELVVARGAKVHATDGEVGEVAEFLIDPRNGHISHIVLREGHFWDKEDVTIPLAEVETMQESEVFLKLDKEAIGKLPHIPVKRWWSRGE